VINIPVIVNGDVRTAAMRNVPSPKPAAPA